jgi:hypothetical protein
MIVSQQNREGTTPAINIILKAGLDEGGWTA